MICRVSFSFIDPNWCRIFSLQYLAKHTQIKFPSGINSQKTLDRVVKGTSSSPNCLGGAMHGYANFTEVLNIWRPRYTHCVGQVWKALGFGSWKEMRTNVGSSCCFDSFTKQCMLLGLFILADFTWSFSASSC